MSTREEYLDGKLLLLNKLLEWTSFQLVKKVRFTLQKKYQLKKLKVGHAGTLDPLADGLMLICTGRKTKEIVNYQGLSKEYMATIKLGATTPSYDLETEIDANYPTTHITSERLQGAIEHFTGEILQRPPSFSAKQINGERAYEKARKGEEVKLKLVQLTIHSLEVLSAFGEMPTVKLRVNCSKGPYIRSLAHDIGQHLDSGAHLTALTRTRVGEFELDQAMQLEEFLEQC